MSSGGLGMGDWTRHQDEVTGSWYLSNSVTGETKWEEQMTLPSEELVTPMSAGGFGMGDWTRHQDEVTGYWYLSNSVTGETKWEEQGSD